MEASNSAEPLEKTKPTGGSGRPPETVDKLDLGTDKPFFKIGEVAEIVGVAAHVLRYWEQEFSSVRPRKSRGKQRLYRKSDIETLLRIKHLLYDRKFTVAGAKSELARASADVPLAAPDLRYRLRQSLARVQVQLDALKAVVAQDEVASGIAADPAGYLRSIRVRGNDDASPNRARSDSPLLRCSPNSTANSGRIEQPLLARPERRMHR